MEESYLNYCPTEVLNQLQDVHTTNAQRSLEEADRIEDELRLRALVFFCQYGYYPRG